MLVPVDLVKIIVTYLDHKLFNTIITVGLTNVTKQLLLLLKPSNISCDTYLINYLEDKINQQWQIIDSFTEFDKAKADNIFLILDKLLSIQYQVKPLLADKEMRVITINTTTDLIDRLVFNKVSRISIFTLLAALNLDSVKAGNLLFLQGDGVANLYVENGTKEVKVTSIYSIYIDYMNNQRLSWIRADMDIVRLFNKDKSQQQLKQIYAPVFDR